MNFDNYTNNSKKIIHNAQNLVVTKKQQSFTPFHLAFAVFNSNFEIVKKIFSFDESFSSKIITKINSEIDKQKSIKDNHEIYASPELLILFNEIEKESEKLGDKYIALDIIALVVSTKLPLISDLINSI